MRDELDRFYTDPGAALELIQRVDIDRYDLIIEPSAGMGAFSRWIPRVYALDIAPGVPDVMRGDWLKTSRDDVPDYQNLLVIGNPPFGIRGAMAKQFIIHSIDDMGARGIAFILPMTFVKQSNQRMFDASWRLIDMYPLGRMGFTLPDGSITDIPCAFYWWSCDDTIRPGVNLRESPAPRVVDFEFLQRGDAHADFVINGNNGRVRDVSMVTNPKAEHYIRVCPGHDVATVRDRLSHAPIHPVSSVSGGVWWVNRDDIRRAYASCGQHGGNDDSVHITS